MQEISLAACHQILSKPTEKLNQMELAIKSSLEKIWGEDIEKFALYAKLATQLGRGDDDDLSKQVIKI